MPPSVVRSEQKHKLVRRSPLECLALESGSPVLGPQRDQRNEPPNLSFTRDFIAVIYGITAERGDLRSTANASRLFCNITALVAQRWRDAKPGLPGKAGALRQTRYQGSGPD